MNRSALCLALCGAAGLYGCSAENGSRRPDSRDGGAVITDAGVAPVDAFRGCTPGAGACDGFTHYTCGPDGQSRTNEQLCDGACDPTQGCVACVPGTRRCDGSVSTACAADASGYVAVRDCAENGSTCGGGGFCNDACGTAESTRSNVGCEYWPVPLANLGSWEGRYDFRVVAANPGTENANIRVFRGDTLVTNAVIPGGGANDIVLPWIEGVNDGLATERTSFGVANGAYRLVSDRPVTVAQFNPFEYDNGRSTIDGRDYSFSNDASLLLPAHSFTGDYIATSFVPLSATQVQSGGIFGEVRSHSTHPGYITVVGTTEAPTTVQVVVQAAVQADRGGRFPATPRGGALSFTINRGEVVHIVAAPPPECSSGRPGLTSESLCPPEQPSCGVTLEFCNEAEYDLSGSRVSANHPIEVFGGHLCAYVPYNAQACDHLETQLPPLQTWGQNFTSGPLGNPGMALENIVRITGARANTTVTITPPQNGVGSLTLGAGQWREFIATSPFTVSATEGVMVTQFLVGQYASTPPAERGDPAMLVLPPREQFRSDYTFVTPTSYNSGTMGQSYLLVTRPAGLNITLDGAPINTTWQTVGDREVGIVPVEGGSHTMQSTDTFGVIVYGMGLFTSYAYPAGLNLEEILLI